MSALADGIAEVLRRTREQLMKGASQIKINKGGVASQYDPLESLQFTKAEMRGGRWRIRLGHLCLHPRLYLARHSPLHRRKRHVVRALSAG
jgi:hypothetical protein